jgi:hypothetical protein
LIYKLGEHREIPTTAIVFQLSRKVTHFGKDMWRSDETTTTGDDIDQQIEILNRENLGPLEA